MYTLEDGTVTDDPGFWVYIGPECYTGIVDEMTTDEEESDADA